jgi:hypothetical protein
MHNHKLWVQKYNYKPVYANIIFAYNEVKFACAD